MKLEFCQRCRRFKDKVYQIYKKRFLCNVCMEIEYAEIEAISAAKIPAPDWEKVVKA